MDQGLSLAWIMTPLCYNDEGYGFPGGPQGPATPAVTSVSSSYCEPGSPFDTLGPFSPFGPIACPGGPLVPFTPGEPTNPLLPWIPLTPFSPGRPTRPGTPSDPISPLIPLKENRILWAKPYCLYKSLAFTMRTNLPKTLDQLICLVNFNEYLVNVPKFTKQFVNVHKIHHQMSKPKDVLEFHGFASSVRMLKECWNFLWGVI